MSRNELENTALTTRANRGCLQNICVVSWDVCFLSMSKRLHTLPAVFTREIACSWTSSRRNWPKYSVNLEGVGCDALSALAVSLHSLCIFAAKALMEPGVVVQLINRNLLIKLYHYRAGLSVANRSGNH